MTEEIKIHGLDELDKKFAKLEVATSRKILRSALSWAAKPLFERMRDAAPSGDDEVYLKRKEKIKRDFSIPSETKKWLSRDSKNGEYSAQVNVGYRLNKVWYVGMLEFGTKHIRPIGWMRKAADENWQYVVARFKKRLQYQFKRLEK
ncbi:MAG: HK97 gp10 family phage protein [Bermanella sp.]